MKWWARFNQLKRHRWLPFFLPVVGTLFYIALALLVVPSDLGEKVDNENGDVEKPPTSAVKRTRSVDTTRRLTHLESTPPVQSAVPSASPAIRNLDFAPPSP
jgi:hypothetical protein